MRQIVHPNCLCKCHIKGQKAQLFDCCSCDCSGQYINEDGSIDIILYNDLLREQHPRKAPYIDGGEYISKNRKGK